VKGGRVQRDEAGRWRQTKAGQAPPAMVNPMTQASDCRHVLQRYLTRQRADAAEARTTSGAHNEVVILLSVVGASLPAHTGTACSPRSTWPPPLRRPCGASQRRCRCRSPWSASRRRAHLRAAREHDRPKPLQARFELPTSASDDVPLRAAKESAARSSASSTSWASADAWAVGRSGQGPGCGRTSFCCHGLAGSAAAVVAAASRNSARWGPDVSRCACPEGSPQR